MIRLFESSDTTFTTQGLGVLNAIRCHVIEERNGIYELEMEIAFLDTHYPDIALGCLILAKPNPYEDAEPFRIYQISRPLNGIVTINAAHWSYDLSKYAVRPFTASSITQAMTRLKSYSVETCPFNFVTDKSVTGNFTVSMPRSIRSLLGGSEGSVLDIYGKGEWKFTGRTCYLYLNRGQDRGVTIRYGKNLTDLTQEENNAEVYSKLYPYWADSDGNLVTLPEYTLDINSNGHGILVYDMSDKWETVPTVAQLRTAAQAYIDSNDLDKPVVNLTLSFEQISELIRDSIYLCDTVSVEFPALGVSAKAKVIKTVYDAVLDRYEKIEVGTVKQSLAQTITTLQDNSITGATGKSVLQAAVDRATAQITGQNGGFFVQNDTNGDGATDEILFLNTLDIDTATKVWRWNLGGLGYSSTGYAGPYGTAITANGEIVADFITAGTLNANLIKAGILQDEAGINSWNMETGEFNVQVSGTVQSITAYYAQSWENVAPPWEDLSGALYDANGEVLYDADGERLYARRIWTTTVPTSTSAAYRWMRNLITYKDGTTQLTSAMPMHDYYGRANLVMKMSTDSDGRPIGIMSGEADYMRFSAGQLVVNSPQFSLDRYGNASFMGAVTATSLTLGSGVNVPSSKVSGLSAIATSGNYNDLINKPTIPDMSNVMYKGDVTATQTTANGITTTVYTVPRADGGTTTWTEYTSATSNYMLFGYSKGTDQTDQNFFRVSNDGLLKARNAVIYGTVYATDGRFAGDIYANSLTLADGVTIEGTVDSVTTYYAESLTNSAPAWDLTGELNDRNGEALYDSNGERLYVRPAWSTTMPNNTTPTYKWMRNRVVYKDGTSTLTTVSPLSDYYARANLVIKQGTDRDGNPIGIMSGLADYMRFDAGQLEINSPQFSLDREGNASFAGAVTATSLTLGSGVNVDVDRVQGFDTKAQGVVEGIVTASYVNALGITAQSVAAENITGTTISGKRIQGGLIYYDANNYWNLQTGEIRISSFASQFSSLSSSLKNTQSAVEALEVGIAIDNNGVTVGRQGANIKGVFGNDSLEFQTTYGTPIAWFSSDASEGLGVDLVQIGSHDTTSQRWIIKTDSNGDRLSFTRRAS